MAVVTITPHQVRQLVAATTPSPQAVGVALATLVVSSAKHPTLDISPVARWISANIQNVLSVIVADGLCKLEFVDDVDAVAFALTWSDVIGSVKR
ncbi:hypothetical protein SAMN06297144_1850 [Sphingomonas guangdongensis]|uniref:Uncharacterized protein n=1 Tax=Sphingomonas guangdongensis TaxID=1141890 RepID=A0A285QY37_9SPHN|nr:hypothetical protein [Sphingomonas guangdongensis]SOB86741.1 hypothetical protein SAMN06297144_1850 [Sphingomonas guangdongensis]